MTFTQLFLIAVLVLSVINCALFMLINVKHHIPYYGTMFILIAIQTLGHVSIAVSSDLQEVILANKIAYVGASFVPMLFFLGELTLCNIKISKALLVGLFSVATVLLLLAFTTGFSDIYYITDSIKLINHLGISDYVTEFGPAHSLYNFMLGSYLLSGVIVFFYSLYTKRNISYRNLILLAILGLLITSGFLISRQLGCDTLVTPVEFLLLEYVTLFIIYRIGKYDIHSAIAETLEFQNESTFISLSEDLRYVGCNDIAEHSFPNLKNIRVDSKIQESDELGKILLDQIRNLQADELASTVNFQYGKMHYKSTLTVMRRGSRIHSYMFHIEDNTKIQRYIKILDNYNNSLIYDIQNKDRHIQAIQEQMILGMTNMVESRDNNTTGHVKRTSQVIKILIAEMRKDGAYRSMGNFFDALVLAAPMHDLGKIAVDEAILKKTGKFTPEEYRIMKTHVTKGASIVENLLKEVESKQVVDIARNVALYHHERYDGSGYPNGLKGTDIPLEARIMAIADVYDALVSKRCYKKQLSYAEAYETMVSLMGTSFDPDLKKIFINCHKELEALYESEKENE